MKDEQFRRIEGRLYQYYKDLNTIKKLKQKVVVLYQQVKRIEDDIKHTNVNVETSLNMGIDYSREKIQTSPSGSSYAETAMIQEIEKLQREMKNKKRSVLKLNARIRQLEERTFDMEYNLSTLNEECKRFVEFKYGEEKSIRWIGEMLYQGATTTASRRRNEIIEEISKFCNLSK